MADDTIQITVRLFAVLRTRELSSIVTMQLPSGATAALLVDRFFADRPALAALQPHIRIARNGTLVPREGRLADLVLEDERCRELVLPGCGGGPAARGREQRQLIAVL